jgi:Acyl-protein synthetase, LuxE
MQNTAKDLKNSVLRLKEENFEDLALQVFRFQAKNCQVYQQYLSYLNINPQDVKTLSQIRFLPIEFFKSHSILSGNVSPKVIFESSGTTGLNTSRHQVADPDFYLKISQQIFENFYGQLSDYQIFALLPSYLERQNSSLVFMVDHFIKTTNSPDSGFFLNDYKALLDALRKASENRNSKTKILLIGVTFALLDLAESGHDLSFLQKIPNLIIMETGGMKGRRKELLREEVHEILTGAFGVTKIHSEYGMTELLSQGYSTGEGVFELPPSMKIFLRDVNDPFSSPHTQTRSGGLNVIDLANIDSCSFIETKDLGYFTENNKFKIIGRFDNSDIRGCNLMV